MSKWLSFTINIAFAVLATAHAPPLPGKNFADPSIIHADGKWWSFATPTKPLSNVIQIASSEDFNCWTFSTHNPLPKVGAWVNPKHVGIWAPDVIKLDSGSFVLYYAALKVGTKGTRCIGAATSSNITGPYEPLDLPIICPDNAWGVFDAAGFKDWDVKGDWSIPSDASHISRENCPAKVDGECGNSFIDSEWCEGGHGGKRYIVYKIQNANLTQPGTRTPLTLQEVGVDGTTLIGEPVTLLTNEKGDFGSIEAPALYKTPDGHYVLTYSKGSTATSEYTVSYAVAPKLTGPYERIGDLLKTGDGIPFNGPGGADMSFDGTKMVFHSMAQHLGAKYTGHRTFHTAEITVGSEDGQITVQKVA